MQTFSQFYLDEASGATKGAGRHLNNLQNHWNENSESFMKRGVYPIVDLPFDRVVKGGIMVMGINPGMTGEILPNMIKYLEKNKQTAPIVYDFDADPKKGRWLFDYEAVIRGVPAGKREVVRRQLDKNFSHFNIKGKTGTRDNWIPLKSRPVTASEYGVNSFHANLNKIFEQVGLPNLRKRIYQTNWIPYSSIDTAKKAKIISSDYNLCKPWITHFIKTTSPQLIVCPTQVFDRMKKLGTMSEDEGGVVVYKPASGTEEAQGKEFSTTKLYQTKILNVGGQDIPVVGMMHWSGAAGGMPQNKGWQKEENNAAVGADLKRLLRGDFNKTIEVDLPS